ncbi:hypothetical protein MPSEU_000483200 [Mayamaea pseudoterrestris]|nr:hypothetical protein MPSEU_000483200 [Mayamaea pseudoterrestris]
MTEGAWLRDLTIHDLLRLGSYLSEQSLRNVSATTIGIVHFSASWCPCFRQASDSDEILQQNLLSTTPRGLQDAYCFAASVILNGTEDLRLYIGDDGRDTPFPVPPSSLPAIAVISLPAGELVPTIAYVNLASEHIYDGLMSNNRESFKFLARELKSLVRDLESSFNIAVSPSSCSSAIRLFIAGDRSSVGKSSVCLGIIGVLLRQGLTADDLAYIKPATQSESTQLIQVYCESVGVDCVPIGPLVYYRGFTRAYLAGETPTSEELLADCANAVDRIARDKKIVLVDGVGFPAVGSICGTDNAAVLKACSYPSENDGDHERRPMGVILVGGSGVGAAVDAFNLNATYFKSKGVPVLGAIFNKLSLTGFYSLESCKEQVTRYFDMQQQNNEHNYIPFGFVPVVPEIAEIANYDHGIANAHDFVRIFNEQVDVAAIVASATDVDGKGRALVPMVRAKKDGFNSDEALARTSKSKLRSRLQIESEAVMSGAQTSA